MNLQRFIDNGEEMFCVCMYKTMKNIDIITNFMHYLYNQKKDKCVKCPLSYLIRHLDPWPEK